MNNEMLITLAGTALAVLAITSIKTKSSVSEGFAGMASMQAVPIGPIGVHNFDSPNAADVTVSRPGYQGTLSPRFNNANMRGPVMYNAAPEGFQASPRNPLTFAQQIGGVNDTVTFQGATPPLPSGYGSPRENYEGGLPIGDMTGALSDDTVVQPLVYDRLIFANRSSRLRSQGDPIRGDLYIKPMNGNWFVPSVSPSVDLQQGAMNVIAGVTNEQGQTLSSGVYTSSGGTAQSLAGVPVSAANVTAFPA